MVRKSVSALLFAAAVLSFAPSLGAAPAPPSFAYLGRLAPGYSERAVIADLQAAGIEVVQADGAWILFRLTERTLPEPWVVSLPFMSRILADPAAAWAERELKGSALPGRLGGHAPAEATGTMRALDARYRAAIQAQASGGRRTASDLRPDPTYLAIYGTLAGTISGAAGTGIPGTVKVYDLSYNTVAILTTSDGLYSLNLAPGPYKVMFEGGAGSDYLSEWHADQPTFAAASTVTITDSMTTTVNAQLTLGGGLSGRITADVGGGGIQGQVHVYNVNPYSYKGFVLSAADGTYAWHALPAGSYHARVEPIGNYVPEYYNNKPGSGTADAVAVTAGETTLNVNFALAAGATVTGRVTDATTGAGLFSVAVDAYDGSGAAIAGTTTDSSGDYTLSRLPTPSVLIRFSASSPYITEYYDDEPNWMYADAVATTAGGTTPGINAQLAQGGKISGIVRGGPLGSGLSGAGVQLYNLNQDLIQSTTTGSDGRYLIEQVAPASYKMKFVPPPGSTLAAEWYVDRPDFATADTVTVGSAADLTIDADLVAAGPTITVTSPTPRTACYLGERTAINWTSSGLAPSTTLKILLFKGGTRLGTLFWGLANDGTETWRIPTTLVPGNDYWLRVRTGDGSVGGASRWFTIAKPSLDVFSPGACAIWILGGKYKIGWSARGTSCPYVKIELFRGTALVRTIAAAAENIGVYGWTFPAGLLPATNYWIRVRTTDGLAVGASAKFTLRTGIR